jgi:hypothetical protein
MMLAHAVLLSESRSYLAALADGAASFDAAMEYERVLLQLDWLHAGTVLPTTPVPTTDRNVLLSCARVAIRNLEHHGLDKLDLAICLHMLETAWALDAEP